MPSYKEWIDEIDINVDYYSAFLRHGLHLTLGIVHNIKIDRTEK